MADSEPSLSPSGISQALSAAAKCLSSAKSADGSTPSGKKSEIEGIASDMAEIRTHLRRAGTGLAAAASAILVGLGYAQLHDAFPLPASRVTFSVPEALVGLLFVLLLAAGTAWVMSHFAGLDPVRSIVVYAAVLVLMTAVVLSGEFDEKYDVDLSLARGLMVALGVLSILAVGGAVWLASRFFGAQRRILIATEPAWTRLADDSERGACEFFFQDVALSEGAASLNVLDLRAARLDRIARHLPADSDAAKRVRAEADSLADLVAVAIYRAALWILEYRSKEVFEGWKTKAALGMTVVGIIGLFGIADYAEGQRSLADLRAKCQKAVEEGAIDACDTVRTPFNQAAVAATAAQKEAAKAARAATLEREKNDALSNAKATLKKGTPTTAVDKREWIEACVILFRDKPALKDEEDLAAKCLALISG